MLAIPESGLRLSVEQHNAKLGVLVDWIEGSALFLQQRVSWSDVIDCLCEENIYHDQDFAAEFVEIAWAELYRRSRRVSDGFPFDVQGRTIEATHRWTGVIPYSFCLWLSLVATSPGWRKTVTPDYSTQGALFERLAAESMKALGWAVLYTGWSRTNMTDLSTLVSSIATHLDEPVQAGATKRWTKEKAKDAGLDIVCRLPFIDRDTGDPRFLFQCASGGDWEKKLCTPNIRRWEKLIDFANPPQRGFAMPFCIQDDEFRQSALTAEGVILDRLRLVDGEPGWEPSALRAEIRKWLQPRVRVLPVR